MPQTTSRGKNVYSVDLMFAYINIFKPRITKIKLNTINYDLHTKGWGEGDISVNSVLKYPQKYKDNYNRIINANLRNIQLLWILKEIYMMVFIDILNQNY